MAEAGRNLEREVKLGAWPGFELPDLGDLADWVAVAEPSSHRLDATYHDAADLRLIRAGVTLRHRLGEGGEEGRWTLKLPSTSASSGTLARTEITLDAPPGAVPEELARAVRGLLRRAPLLPVARLQTDRRVMVLRDGGGRAVGEVADDEVTVLDGERVAARFRELEVEAASGRARPAARPRGRPVAPGRGRCAGSHAEAGAGARPARPRPGGPAEPGPRAEAVDGRGGAAGHRRRGAAAAGPRPDRAPRPGPGRRPPGPGQHPAAAQRPAHVRSGARRGLGRGSSG